MKSILLFCLKLAVSTALLVFAMRGIDFQGTQSRIAGVMPLEILAVVACACLQLVLAAWRWIITTEILCGIRMSVGRAVGLSAFGGLTGQVLPSTIGGDFVRVGFVAQVVGFGMAARSVIADRILGLLVLGALVLLSTVYLAWLGPIHPTMWIPAGLALSSLTMTAAIIAVAPWGERLPSRLRSLAAPARDLRVLLCSREGWFAIALALVAHLLSVAMFLVLAIAISFDGTKLLSLALMVSPALFVSAVPVSVGGWGIREGAFSIGLGTIGVASEDAILISVMFGLITFAICGLASVVWFLWKGDTAIVSAPPQTPVAEDSFPR